MKLPRQKRDETSAAIAQTLWLIAACSALFIVTAFASNPSWWSTPGPGGTSAVNSSFASNDYAVVNEGQLKQFTARAVDELNSGLGSYGSAGSNLDTLVINWSNDYETNGYGPSNIKPSDYQAMRVGQLKYIGNQVWNQLISAGYTDAPPYWLDVNTNTDGELANLGQLKTVFNFDLNNFSSEAHITSTTTANGMVGTSNSYTITTTSNNVTSYDAIDLPVGLSIDTSNGEISGTPLVGGVYDVVLSASNSNGTTYGTVTLTINPSISLPVITSATSASGIVGLPFNYAITASDLPTSFSAIGLPSGLSLNTGTGVISGAPAAAGTTNVTLGAINDGGTTTTNLTLSISNPSAPMITSGTNVSGDVGVMFSYTITATSNPTSFSVTNGMLPGGLSLNTSNGEITGTPTTTDSTNVTLQASNAGGTGSANLILTINGASVPIITSTTTAFASSTNSFSYTITATSNPTSFAETGLPSGLSLNTSDGVISGMPSSTDTFTSSVVISATNGSGTGTGTLMIMVNPLAPIITSSTNVIGYVGLGFDYAITTSNAATSFSAMGLPLGLSLDPTTGVISGTPTTTNTSTVSLAATNAGGTGTATLTLTIDIPLPVPVINSPTVATGDAGVPFSYAITTATLPTPTNYYASGLPSGLSVNTSTGLISGTSSVIGTTNVTLSASNGSGTGTQNLMLTINPAGAPIISSTNISGSVGASFTYMIDSSNSPTNYSASGLPEGLTLGTNGMITGTPELAGTSTVILSGANIDGTGTATLTLTINPPVPVITSTTTASGAFGVPFTYAITASYSPTSFSATGLPPGLSIDSFTGVISGAPSAAGTTNVTLGATNAGGTGTATLALAISGPSVPVVTRSIATGYDGSLLLKSDGTVWAAGYNAYGQLGNGGNADSATYTKIPGLSGIVAVAEGAAFSYALKSDGTLWAWGWNGAGQLGDGTNTNSNVPVQVTTSGSSNLTGIIAIAAGANGGVALKSDFTVWTLGDDYYGELGNGIRYGSGSTAVEVLTSTSPSPGGTPLTGVVGIACGADHYLAVKGDGTVWAWGDNSDYELGNETGTNSPSDVAVQVSGIGGFITSVTGGNNYSLALASDGTVWAWGNESNGYLGNGPTSVTTTSNTGPVQVLNSTGGVFGGVAAISSQGDHTLALKSDGTVWAWGQNEFGELGNGTVSTNSPFPVQVSNLSGVVAVSAGNEANTALESDGSLWGWGYNSQDSNYGAGGASTPVALPVTVPNLPEITAIAAAKSHYLALDSSGNVWTWDDVTPGEIGNGTTVMESSSPVEVQGISGVTNIACGAYFNMALKTNGTVWAWGQNNYGQLGDGTNIDSQTPVQVSGLTNITAIACGAYSGMALDSTNNVWTWGENNDGQLGNGSTANTNTAAKISGVSNVTAIAGGASHALALESSGTVYGWGLNEFGELGTNSLGGFTSTPEPISGFGTNTIIAVAAGYSHSMALDTSNEVLTWGLNTDGELGNGTTANSDTPEVVSSLSGLTIIQIGENAFHSVALESHGMLFTWGDNTSGQLGVGTFGPTPLYPSPTGSTAPVQVLGIGGGSATITGLACGKYSTVALESDGTVLQWGDNSYEPYGFSIPIQVAGPTTNPPPVITPAAGSISSSSNIYITTTISGSNSIYYTLDGTEPSASSTLYSGPFMLSTDALVSAAVFIDGAIASPVASSQFYIDDTDQTGLPLAVSGLSATTTSNGEIDLSWTLGAETDFSAIDVYRSSNGGVYQLVTTLSPSTTNYYDANVLGGTNYYQYYVGTLNSSGESSTTDTSSISLPSVTNLDITVTAPSGATNLP